MSRLGFFGIFLGLFIAAYSVPLVVNTLDSEEIAEDDDFTTHTLERLSSAATCLVAGVEYTHGQQIYRADQCEFCLCLDGEMFCWWQDCPPTLEGPCKERGPFSPCLNGAKPKAVSRQGTSNKAVSSISKTTRKTKDSTTSSSKSTEPSSGATVTGTSTIITAEEMTTKSAVKTCVVMGREYKIGDKLPHDTGNCVECVCGTAGQVTCSPNQCAPAGDEINDYQAPGPRSPLADMF